MAKDVFAIEKRDGYTLSAKTGTNGKVGEQPAIGWYVGYVEKKDGVYFFAFNMGGDVDESPRREFLSPGLCSPSSAYCLDSYTIGQDYSPQRNAEA